MVLREKYSFDFPPELVNEQNEFLERMIRQEYTKEDYETVIKGLEKIISVKLNCESLSFLPSLLSSVEQKIRRKQNVLDNFLLRVNEETKEIWEQGVDKTSIFINLKNFFSSNRNFHKNFLNDLDLYSKCTDSRDLIEFNLCWSYCALLRFFLIQTKRQKINFFIRNFSSFFQNCLDKELVKQKKKKKKYEEKLVKKWNKDIYTLKKLAPKLEKPEREEIELLYRWDMIFEDFFFLEEKISVMFRAIFEEIGNSLAQLGNFPVHAEQRFENFSQEQWDEKHIKFYWEFANEQINKKIFLILESLKTREKKDWIFSREKYFRVLFSQIKEKYKKQFNVVPSLCFYSFEAFWKKLCSVKFEKCLLRERVYFWKNFFLNVPYRLTCRYRLAVLPEGNKIQEIELLSIWMFYAFFWFLSIPFVYAFFRFLSTPFIFNFFVVLSKLNTKTKKKPFTK